MTLPAYLPPLRDNPILDVDSYKLPMHLLYRPGIRRVYSFIESRGGENDEIMMAGSQPLLYKMGQPIEDWMIDEAQEFAAKHFGYSSYFNRLMWDEIVNKHDRRLPLEIRALPEGLIVPKRTPMITVENTGGAITAPLTTWQETRMLRNFWPAASIATRVFRMKQRIKPYFDRTSDNGISPFAILDFSSRGVFGDDHSKLAGAVFTFMFQGSDNIPGVRYANYYYGSDMAAYSVLATEHSIASGWVRDDDSYIDHALNVAEPGSIVSLVADTWNVFEFTKKLMRADRLDLIRNKDLKVVVRPDSGERHAVLPELLRPMAQAVGTTTNKKGFEVLNLNLKVLWADGMNEHTVTDPFEIAEGMGISADSVFTGSGGGIASADLDRDTDKWAMKASAYSMEDGTEIEVFKDPITDPGKKSKKGRFSVLHIDGIGNPYTTVRRNAGEERPGDFLTRKFLDGYLTAPETLDPIRARVDSQLS